MTSVTELETRRKKCPICETMVDEIDLAKAGLTREELQILKRHRENQTLGKLIHLVDIAMRKINPEKLLQESENKRFQAELTRMIEQIREKLEGTAIGKVGEVITLKDLKSAFPQDRFSDEKAAKGGTDIVAIVVEGKETHGTIAVSVKYDVTWKSTHLTQLRNNLHQERTPFGILVTKTFPSEALNERIYFEQLRTGEIILLVKPEYLPVAYAVFRLAVMSTTDAEKKGRNIENIHQNQNKILKDVITWANSSKFTNVLKDIDAVNQLSESTDAEMEKMERYVKSRISGMHELQEELRNENQHVQSAIEELKERLSKHTNGGDTN